MARPASTATDGIKAHHDGPAIETSGLRMRYGTRDVVNGIDLQVARGEVRALLGPNGAGKTTTIEVLEGFRRRSGGHVRVLGTDPDHATEDWQARLGVVMQSWRDHPRWRVGELLAQLGRFYRPYRTQEQQRPLDLERLLTRVGLGDHASARIQTLSGGQRRRLDVAAGLIGNPELLFLDEPTTGFDPQARDDFHALVGELAAGRDTTILLTTHDLDEAEKLADNITIIANGRIVVSGTPAELSAQVSAEAEVRYTLHGSAHCDRSAEPTRYVRDLLARFDDDALSDLEIRRPRLAETYRALVHDAETSSRSENTSTTIPEPTP